MAVSTFQYTWMEANLSQRAYQPCSTCLSKCSLFGIPCHMGFDSNLHFNEIDRPPANASHHAILPYGCRARMALISLKNLGMFKPISRC